MIKIFIFVLFLIYFWYFYLWYSKPVPKPGQGQPSSSPPPYNVEFLSPKKDTFQFKVNGKSVWEDTIPNSFAFANKQLVHQNICHSRADGEKVLAEGMTLYNYLKDNLVSIPLSQFKMDASTVLQKGNVFYFTCQGGLIYTLDKCPSGQLFFNGTCDSIEECVGKKDDTLLPLKDDIYSYIRCVGGKNIVEKCPPDTFFLFSRCLSKNDLTHYCSFSKDSFLLNDTTRVDCVDGLPVYVFCDKGLKFFDLEKCEPSVCQGKPNGTKLPTDQRIVDGLSFYGSYIECQDNRVAKTIMCPQFWDPYLSNGEDLTSLPQVFDGQQCSIPNLCTNVEPLDRDTFIPLHEFSKHIGNWGHASLYDSLAGYRCRGNKRERVDLPPGQCINKRFKRESACLNNKTFVPILGKPSEYYDCRANRVQSCPMDHEFDGSRCKLAPSHPFKFNNVSLFQFDSLTHDNWIPAWVYGNKNDVRQQPCHPPSIYLKNYNICTHPDCEKYAFLAHIPSMRITDVDGSVCAFEPQERLLTKTPSEVERSFDFWAQRKVMGPIPGCVPGQNLKTGNFVWDKTLFATCNEDQPFVFCPSSSTEGIVHVEGKVFACKLPETMNKVLFQGNAQFEQNEIKRILPSKTNQVVDLSSNYRITLPNTGLVVTNALDLHTTDPVTLEYRYRVTHPPNVVYQDGIPIVSNKGGVFLIKRADFTQLYVHVPEYNVQPFMSDFK